MSAKKTTEPKVSAERQEGTAREESSEVSKLRSQVESLVAENKALTKDAESTIQQQQDEINRLAEENRELKGRLGSARTVDLSGSAGPQMPSDVECFFEGEETPQPGDYICQLPGSRKKIVRGCSDPDTAEMVYRKSMGISASTHKTETTLVQ